ncbi:MAG: hypothetical protein KJP09_11505 [Bacteroidia bacterium]|nr:hypothetical protein [Bacteroidia bacterium]NNK28571.1 hypothetical protein [Flavobacteriaceae bacterium]
MKRLLSFTFLLFFSFYSMYAVQQEDITIKELESTVKDKANELAIDDKASLIQNKAIVKRKRHVRSARQIQGIFGHAIKRASHRELIDKRKRIAGNY